MIEVCIHGSGGQEVVFASEVLATAFFRDGQHIGPRFTFKADYRGALAAAFQEATRGRSF